MSDDRTMTPVGPHAFLFDTRHPAAGDAYGVTYGRAFATGLLNVDTSAEVTSRLLHGDVLLSAICERLVEVDAQSGPRRIGAMYSVDTRLISSLVWDLSEAIATQWQTLEADELPIALGGHRVYCITLPTLPLQLRDALDASLRAQPGYLGAFAIDLGSPVQRLLFGKYLLHHQFIERRQIMLLNYVDGGRLPEPDWGTSPAFDTVRVLDPEAFEAAAPPPMPAAATSLRGQATLALLTKKGRPSVRERVGRGLLSGKIPEEVPLHLVTRGAPMLDDVVVSEEKLTGYVLNVEHPKGGDKARLFRDLLAIEASDWRYLAAQLIEGLRNSDVRRARGELFENGAWGIKYEADIPVIGRNGKHRLVRTGWIVRSEEPMRLTTAYVADQRDQIGTKGITPPVVPADVIGDARWAALLNLASTAGRRAAAATIPSPMRIISGWPGSAAKAHVELEGACGGAYVLVQDGHRGFAGWLHRSGIGEKEKGAIQRVWADVNTQSQERAEAYARAFANVLRLNDVPCTVKVYLD